MSPADDDPVTLQEAVDIVYRGKIAVSTLRLEAAAMPKDEPQETSPDYEQTRRELIALRTKYGATSPIGHRCSNIIELLQAETASADIIQRQVSDLQRLVGEHRNRTAGE